MARALGIYLGLWLCKISQAQVIFYQISLLSRPNTETILSNQVGAYKSAYLHLFEQYWLVLPNQLVVFGIFEWKFTSKTYQVTRSLQISTICVQALPSGASLFLKQKQEQKKLFHFHEYCTKLLNFPSNSPPKSYQKLLPAMFRIYTVMLQRPK